MKACVRVIGVAAAFLLFAGVQPAGAQVIGAVEFTTTFPFAVGNANVPAGTYTIRPDDDAPAVLILTGAHVGVVSATTSPFSTGSGAGSVNWTTWPRYGCKWNNGLSATTVQLRSFFAPLGRSTVIAADHARRVRCGRVQLRDVVPDHAGREDLRAEGLQRVLDHGDPAAR